MRTKSAIKVVTLDFIRCREQLVILGFRHRFDQRLDIGVSGDSCIEAHDLPDTPRGAKQRQFAVQCRSAHQAIILVTSPCTIVPWGFVTDIRCSRIELAPRLLMEYVLLEQDGRTPVSHEAACP